MAKFYIDNVEIWNAAVCVGHTVKIMNNTTHTHTQNIALSPVELWIVIIKIYISIFCISLAVVYHFFFHLSD